MIETMKVLSTKLLEDNLTNQREMFNSKCYENEVEMDIQLVQILKMTYWHF